MDNGDHPLYRGVDPNELRRRLLSIQSKSAVHSSPSTDGAPDPHAPVDNEDGNRDPEGSENDPPPSTGASAHRVPPRGGPTLQESNLSRNLSLHENQDEDRGPTETRTSMLPGHLSEVERDGGQDSSTPFSGQDIQNDPMCPQGMMPMTCQTIQPVQRTLHDSQTVRNNGQEQGDPLSAGVRSEEENSVAESRRASAQNCGTDNDIVPIPPMDGPGIQPHTHEPTDRDSEMAEAIQGLSLESAPREYIPGPSNLAELRERSANRRRKYLYGTPEIGPTLVIFHPSDVKRPIPRFVGTKCSARSPKGLVLVSRPRPFHWPRPDLSLRWLRPYLPRTPTFHSGLSCRPGSPLSRRLEKLRPRGLNPNCMAPIDERYLPRREGFDLSDPPPRPRLAPEDVEARVFLSRLASSSRRGNSGNWSSRAPSGCQAESSTTQNTSERSYHPGSNTIENTPDRADHPESSTNENTPERADHPETNTIENTPERADHPETNTNENTCERVDHPERRCFERADAYGQPCIRRSTFGRRHLAKLRSRPMQACFLEPPIFRDYFSVIEGPSAPSSGSSSSSIRYPSSSSTGSSSTSARDPGPSSTGSSTATSSNQNVLGEGNSSKNDKEHKADDEMCDDVDSDMDGKKPEDQTE